MPPSCPRAHQWLRLTFYQWLQPIQRGVPRHHPARIASRHVSTTSAINRGLRAEADSKEQLPRSNFRDHVLLRSRPKTQEAIERDRSRGFGRRGELLVRKHAGESAPPYREEHARTADVLRTRRAKGWSQLTPANYTERSSRDGERESGMRRVGGIERARRTRKSAAATEKMQRPIIAETSATGTQGFTRDRILQRHGTETPSKAWAMREQAMSMHLQSQAATKDPETVNGEFARGFGRDTFIEDEHSDQDVSMPLPAVRIHKEPVQDEDTTSYTNGRLAAVDGRKPAGLLRNEDYKDLYPLLSTLQLAESTPGSNALALRNQAKSQLSKMINTLNASSPGIGVTVHLLREAFGPHTTIGWEEDKEQDILWTRHRVRPRNMPKSIIWFDRETGYVELITADHKALVNKAINRALLKQAKETLQGQQDSSEARATTPTLDPDELNGIRRRPTGSIITMRSHLTQCGMLLQRIQDAQETEAPFVGHAQEGNVDAMIAELSDLVSKVNKICIELGEVQSSDVGRALVKVLGLPGKFWTKAHPNSKKTMLFFDEAQGSIRLMLQQPQDNKTNGPSEDVSDAPEKQSNLEGKTPGERHVQKVRDILDRCRSYLQTIHRAEQYDMVLTHRTRPTLRLQEDRVVALVAQVNMLIEEGHVEWAAVMFATRRELGKRGKFWTIAPPQGNNMMIWAKEEESRLEVVRKAVSPSSEEVTEGVREPTRLNDVSSTRQSSSYEPAASQSKVGGQSERKGVPERMRIQDGRTTIGTSSGRLKANGYRDDMPISVPHTTAASTFMYGSNAVLACLSAKKRQCYHLYINRPAIKGSSDKKNLEQIEQLARAARIPISTDANPALLDRMSNRRPHNGVILETSQVPAPPVLGLGKPDLSLSMMPVQLERQSAEEVAVNGAPSALPTLTKTWRHPFILMLDGILDEGNMGNIIRTAYFYGVDGVAVSKNTCASVNSAIVSKASSGAIEAVQILSLPQPSKFVYNSLLASWRVYAAVAPSFDNNVPANDAAKYVTHSSIAARSPLRDHPCILMLGAEGEGLRDNLKNRADHFVSIEQGERGSMPGGLLPGIGVDSMNVASAAGVLVESFMRKPAGALPLGIGSALGF